MVGNINSPVSNTALQWEKCVENVASPAISRVSAGVEHGDNLDSNNLLLSLKTLARKVSSNILEKEKPKGKLRICIDPSQIINRAIQRPRYTIPTI